MNHDSVKVEGEEISYGLIHSARTQKFSKNLTFLTSWYAYVRVCIRGSLIHLMRVTARAPTSIRATNLMRVKIAIARAISIYNTYCLGHWNEENERTKTLNSIVYHFTLPFVSLSWTWMLYLHVWLQNEGKILIWSDYYNEFGIYQRSRISLITTVKQLM